ncbi:MAG: hypothetical protein WC819_01535 [Parcubacteria group bacterium]|jgi:hypothetical protein
MPNIEMHGFPMYNEDVVVKDVRCVFAGASFQDKYVITSVLSDVRDHYGDEKPFFRVFVTPDDPLDEIVKRLKTLKYDIEVVPLLRFIPKEE